jgi:hypothetical protein
MQFLERAFAKMGARIKFAEIVPDRRRQVLGDFALDIRRDARGEYFLVSRQPRSGTEFEVLDVQPRCRHLLLLSRTGGEKHRFLLGHDERHWFVAGVPETTRVSRVKDAMQALKPEAVLECERNVRTKHRDRRSNRARIRQGEWFFVPAPNVSAPELLTLRDEPIVRSGGGKPHMCERLFRMGGETVYVTAGFPNGITEELESDAPQSDGLRARQDSPSGSQNCRAGRVAPSIEQHGRSIVRDAEHRLPGLVAVRIL